MTGMEWLILPVIIKYAVNLLNAAEPKLEAWVSAQIPNWLKWGLATVLSWIATHLPVLQPYLPHQIDPNTMAAIVAVLTNLFHHGMELLLAAISRLKIPAHA